MSADLAAGLGLAGGAASGSAAPPTSGGESFYFDEGERADIITGSFRVMLLDRVPDRAASRRADIAGEVRGYGYKAGGKPVATTLHAAFDDEPARFELGGATWGPARLAATGAAYYESRGSAEDDIPFAYIDFGETVRCTDGDFIMDPSTVMLKPPPEGPEDGAAAVSTRPPLARLGTIDAFRAALAAMEGVRPVVGDDGRPGVASMIFWPVGANRISWSIDKFAVMLVNAHFAPVPEMAWRSDIPAEAEVSGPGYQRRPVRVTATRAAGAAETKIALGGALWPDAEFGAIGAIFYADRGAPDRDLLIAFVNFRGAVIAEGGPFELDPSVIVLGEPEPVP